MARLVHLVPASRVRTIERSGIRGRVWSIREGADDSSRIERAVFAMPVVPDFSVTYQWVRELRRGHDEKMVAVHFTVPRDEEVLVGRYNAPHELLPLRDAMRRVLESPAGNEIIVMRSVRRSEVIGIRAVTQLVGWTEVPPPHKPFDCLCSACVPAGTRDLVRRVNAELSRHLVNARKAKSPAEVATALRSLATPLERARGRIGPDKVLAFARAESAVVRVAVACLLGYFRWRDVELVLARLLDDSHADVRANALESMIRAGGAKRSYSHARDREDALLRLIEHLEYGRDVVASAKLLSVIASGESEKARAHASTAAAKILRDDDLPEEAKQLLEAIVAAT